MALGLSPAVGARSNARCFLGHLSEVPSPWPLACCCMSAEQGVPDHTCSSSGCSRKCPWVCLTAGAGLTPPPGRDWPLLL